MRFVILLVVFGLVGWTMARTIRDRASRSPAVKRRLLTLVAILVGDATNPPSL